MRRQINMIAAVVLLCAVGALRSDGADSLTCPPSDEEECFLPAAHLNASDPVTIHFPAGKKLHVSLEGFSGPPVCQWLRGAHTVATINGSSFMVTKLLSEADSGRYTLTCEATNRSRSYVVDLRVFMKRPTKPRLLLEGVNRESISVLFNCSSEGVPKPTVAWTENTGSPNVVVNNGRVESVISSTDFSASQVLCCATNAEGQECSQIYSYDMDTDKMTSDEVSDVTLSPAQSLVLCCQIQRDFLQWPVWMKAGRELNSTNCDKVCIDNGKHEDHLYTYLLIRSLQAEHSGTYTCRGLKNKTKSVQVHVQAEGLLSARLDEKTLLSSAQAAAGSCLRATVSYHPVLQHCYWEAPDKHVTKCQREEWVTKHRTVELCEPLMSGEYKLHLKSGEQNLTKTTSVCVVDNPKFKRSLNGSNNNFVLETTTLVPANYSWMSCPIFNDSCDADSGLEEIPNTAYADTSVFCHKTIRSSLSRSQVEGHHVKFCLKNSVGSWCHDLNILPSSPQASTGDRPDENGTMVLKVGSFFLLLALALVSFVLVYFIRKKKPQYQPQLQIIQMVGPNDNDYIYINFKDFEYDRKLEFPRENLKLGKELGSGAFGTVVQATAYGINKPGVSLQVAVKMLKEKHQSVEKEALMSELKMLTHIGHHVNIVNLLGACTDTGPIYLIFQYCCFGDLLNYLKNNSERYHKSVTDAFNKDRFSNLYHNLQPKKNSSELEGAIDNYIPMYGSTTRGQEDMALLTLNSSEVDCYEDPEIYERDKQSDDLQALTFDDLLNFAFQVARGMEFLSSKNCIHRDLAARNVLVTKGRLVKIGDFGLARDIDNDSNYVVRGNVRLPVKWMAPESIFQGMYTMKSDVWAYGILLWEIFSLGITPYPGMKVDHTFYSMIEKGFKMEAPYYVNESVYEMMCMCWALDPSKRPTFSKLVSFMCDQLTDREEKLYHNMLDQTSSNYQNSSAILDIPAMTKENKNTPPVANDYCQTHPSEDVRAETSDTVETEKERLKHSE